MYAEQALSLLANARLARVHAMYLMYNELMVGNEVDEISLLFATERELDNFLIEVAPYVDHFNGVRDRLHLQDYSEDFNGLSFPGSMCSEPDDEPHGSGFDVRFEFLRIWDNWRIEAMVVTGGCAPLHFAHLAAQGSGCVVHASYKCPNESVYQLHTQALKEGPKSLPVVPFMAEYSNGYGRFSYWRAFGDRFYMKPRVNLRDQ